MVLKSTQSKNAVERWVVLDNNGNTLFDGTLEDALIYYNANKENEIKDAYVVDGSFVDKKRTPTGEIKLNEGWKDLKAKFSVASQGGNAPAIADLPNGVRIRRFSANDSMHVEYHIDHDLIESQISFPHIHMFSDLDMQIGETISWEFIYIGSKGYVQGGNFLAPRTTIVLTYTADKIVTAGDHIIIEGSTEIEGLDLLEPDTQFLCEAKYIGGTFGGNIYGIQADIHYRSNHETTIGKRPPFDVVDS